MINDMAQEPAKTTAAKSGATAEPAADEVERFLNEQQAIEGKRQDLIKDLLRQKEAAMKSFDDKLAKLGYDGAHTRKRSHHKGAGDKKAE